MSYRVEFRKIRAYKTAAGAVVKQAVIFASVDGHPVIWDARGWRCNYPGCDDVELCPHIDAVEDLLWPGVLAGWRDDE
jgi:hypothetical protein